MGSRTDSTIGWSGLFLALFLSPCLVCGQEATQPKKDAAKATPHVSEKERPPFDLTYVPPEATGVLAIRPNAIFHDPAMQPLAPIANDGLTKLLHSCQLPVDPKLPIEEIEQVIGSITTFSDKKKISQGLQLSTIRVAHNFDWLKLMRRLDPKTKEIQSNNGVYYRSHLTAVPTELQGVDFIYLLPDKAR